MSLWQSLYWLLVVAHWWCFFVWVRKVTPDGVALDFFASLVLSVFWPLYAAWLLADAYWQEFKS